MAAKVTLQVIRDKTEKEAFTFDKRTTFLIGRGRDCNLQLPNDTAHQTISRYHCFFDINPPFIQVRDLESLNGTYVNDRRIERQTAEQKPRRAARFIPLEHVLKNGDEVRVGPTVFQVSIQDTEAFRQASESCVRCGKNIGEEIEMNRSGDYLCASCRSNPQEILNTLFKLAEKGDKDLAMIREYSFLEECIRSDTNVLYRACHKKTGEQVGIKMIIPQVPVDESSKKFFLHEAENAKTLEHPNIVRLMDYGYARGVFLFIQEYCTGGNIDELIFQSDGRLPVQEAAKIIFQVLDGVEYAHTVQIPGDKKKDGPVVPTQGMIHQNIHPAGIFLSDPGYRVKIADFGLARAFVTSGLSGSYRTGSVGGKPVFMPRIQMLDFHYSQPDVDIWTTAASLYNMLTGHFPRDFPSDKDPFLVLLQTQPIPILDRDPSIPPKLAEAIDTILMEKPNVLRTATEFKKLLEGALNA